MSSEVVVLIGTGSIGLAIGRHAATNRTLLLADYNEPQLTATSKMLFNEGYEVHTQVVDVSNREAVSKLAERASSLGSVTRLIHAAGVSPNQASPEQIVNVDLLGTAYVLEAFGKIIGKGGAGVVVASQAGHMGDRLSHELEHDLAYASIEDLQALPALASIDNSMAAYILAKRANALRVQAAAVTWSKRFARINCLSPGIIATPLARDEMSGPHAGLYQNMIKTSAARRMGTPAELGEFAAVLLDERGSFISGSDFLVDGGVVAAMRAGEFEI